MDDLLLPSGSANAAAAPDSIGQEGDRAQRDAVVIAPWIDPVVDELGFAVRSEYVERYWLSTLGPTSSWLLRRLDAGFDEFPDGYVLDLDVTAAALGLAHRRGASSPFSRAFQRCVMFGLAHPRADGYLVRRIVPELPRRHLLRLPAVLRQDHDDWVAGRHQAPLVVAG